MIKKIQYLFQTIFVFIFLVIKALGLKIGRKVFSKLFLFIGPIFKSNGVIMSNLDKIANFTYQEKIQLKIKCGKIMEKLFLNICI